MSSRLVTIPTRGCPLIHARLLSRVGAWNDGYNRGDGTVGYQQERE